MVNDVLLQIHTRSNLRKHNPLLRQAEHGPLRDNYHFLASRYSIPTVKGNLRNLFHRLDKLSFLPDTNGSSFHRLLQSPRLQRSSKDSLFGILADVHKATGPHDFPVEFMYVDISVPVELRKAEEGDIQTAAIIKIELSRHVDYGPGIDTGPEVNSLGGNSSDDPRLHGEGELIAYPLLLSYDSYTVTNSHTYIPDVTRLYFHQCAPCNNLSLIKGNHSTVLREVLDIPAGNKATGRHTVQLGLSGDLHDSVHQVARYLHFFAWQGPCLHHSFHLRDYDPAVVMGGHSCSKTICIEHLVFHGDITLGIRTGAPDKGYIRIDAWIKQPLFSINDLKLDQLLLCHIVQTPPLLPGIQKCAQAYMGQNSGSSCCRGPHQLRHRSHWKVICLNLIAFRHFTQAGRLAPVAADVPLHQPFLCQRGHSLVPPVPQSGRVVKGQVSGCLGLAVALRQGTDQLCGLIDPAPAAAHGHHIGVFDQFHCLCSCHNWNSAYLPRLSACFLFQSILIHIALTSFIVFHTISAPLNLSQQAR